MFLAESIVMEVAMSSADPPKNDEYAILPDASSFITNASPVLTSPSGGGPPVESPCPPNPANVFCSASLLNGNDDDSVYPAMYALPSGSMTMSSAASSPALPMYVE